MPIYEIEAELVRRLRAGSRLILQAPTGSGKSTQVPRMLLQHGFLDQGQAVVLQPRRLAARLLACRVAQELGGQPGQTVGYQIRFDNVTSAATRIRYVTEGLLLRQMLQDESLPGVQVLVFDEFHERHLYGDITLARALELQAAARPDLKIVVMSATLDTGALEAYLHPCSVLKSEGRMFPVAADYFFRRPELAPGPVWELAVRAFEQAAPGLEGDVLVFMPGGYEIQRTLDALRQCPAARGYLLLPLYGELSAREQDAAVARHRQPKIVVATNVAETSITIDGIRLVIDGGLARVARYDANRGINTLLVERISQAAADQRMGRAGRTAPGRCVRLWSHQEHLERPAHETPEIRRLDLAEVVLTLKAAGITHLRGFRWLEPPGEQGLRDAEELLTDLGALDDTGKITPVGRQMLAFPLHPRYARMMLAAREYGCVYHAALVAALTQGRDLLLRNPGAAVETFRARQFGEEADSDFWLLMRAWEYAAAADFQPEVCQRAGLHAATARQVRPLLEHFLRIAREEGLPVRPGPLPEVALRKCLLLGFADRLARRLEGGSGRCDLVHGRRGSLARETVVKNHALIVAAEVREVEGPGQTVNTILSLITGVEPEWLPELFPEAIERRPFVRFEPSAKRVCAEEQLCFHGVPFDRRHVEPPPLDEAARLLATEVQQGGAELREWDESVDQWIWRVNLLGRWCPEFQLPPIMEEDRRMLLEQVCHGAISCRELRDREVKPVVKSWLTPAQQDLVENHAPERFALPNGKRTRIHYPPDGHPYLAVRIQELYGLDQTPRIALKRTPLTLQILAPSHRPVQVTQDLAGFWREHYPRLKQELQRRYPKHEWR